MNVHVPLSLPSTPDAMLRSLREALPALGAAGLDADRDGCFPAESVRRVAETGLLAAFAPVRCGGLAFAGPQDVAGTMLDALRLVGRADLSLGRVVEGHINGVLLFGWYGSDRQLNRLAADLRRNRVFGVWATEPAPGVVIDVTGSEAALRGAKSFATGAGHIDRAIITARTGDRSQLVVVPADRPERTDASGWTMRGMKGTLSGRYDLTGLSAAGDATLGAPGDYLREPRFTAGAWRFTAVQLGGIERIVGLMRELMTETAREDPLQRVQFADAVVAARTAYLWVREAAVRAVGERDDAVPFALMTRGVVERAGLDVMERATRVIGTRSCVTGTALDKAIRDLGLYLRQAGPEHAKDRAATAWLHHDCWGADDTLW